MSEHGIQEKELMVIERIRLIQSDFGSVKTLDFRFLNESYSYNSSSEDIDCEIEKEQAIELINHLKCHFNI